MNELSHFLPWIVFVPFAAAVLALIICRWAGKYTGVLMVLAAIFSFSTSLYLFTNMHHGEPWSYVTAWMPAVNINLAFQGDGFGLFFAMLVSGIGTLVGIYSLSYIPPLPNGRLGRYYAALIAFMGAMLGISLSNDLMLMFVFWEITSITSFILIGFWYEQENAKKGALTALQVTVLGGLAMMVGFVMIGAVTGTFCISELAHSHALQHKLANSFMLIPALLLVFAGAFTKSAQVPFHFWLPNAMVAPTPVSTYLHAATMVKAGIFLVGRMLPIFGEAYLWSPILIAVGMVTFVLTAYQAFREHDLKAILARTTLSTLGLVMMIYGLKAASQDALQILNHAAYKGSLFLVAGIVEHATHTRDIRKLGGLRKEMPITFWLCVLGALSMAGLPPFMGFVAKESLYGELLHNEVLHNSAVLQWLVIGGSVLANAFIFAVSFKLIIGIFLGQKRSELHHVHDATPGLWLPPLVLVLTAVSLGILGALPYTSELVNAFSSDTHAHAHVSLLPEHFAPVVLSLITISLGIGIYYWRSIVNQIQDQLDRIPPMQWVWDNLMAGATWIAVGYSSRWQNGSLRWYLSIILSAFVGLVTFALYKAGITFDHLHLSLQQAPWYGLALCALLIIATMTVIQAKTRLMAAIAMTAVGFLVSTLFVVYRSPDILLTQILIETVSTIFILLVLFYMPAFQKDKLSPPVKLYHLLVSGAVGLVSMFMILLCMSPQFRELGNLGAGYLSKALTEGGGQNAVNVIIVDMRAIDTTGEITVLVVVGLCVYGLLRARRVQA